MRIGGTRSGRGSQLVLATGVWLAALAAAANAQFFGSTQSFDSSFTLRPPRDVPSAPPAPAQSLIPPSGNVAPSAAPKGPLLQSLPASPGAAQGHAAVSVPSVPAGQGALAVSARFGNDLPAINGGLHWRVYRTEQNGIPRRGKEEKGPTPTFGLPSGNYVVNVGFGLAPRPSRTCSRSRPAGCVSKAGSAMRRFRPARFRSTSTRAASSSPATSARSPLQS